MPLSFLESISKKNCNIFSSFLLFESTFPKLLCINHKVLVQQDIYLEKPFPMMWMYLFFNTDFVIVQHASKLFNWTSFLTWGKNFVKSYKFLLLFKNVLEQKMIWLLEKKMSYTWLHIMEFPEKEMMSAKHPETFLERLSWCYKWGLKSASIFDLNYRGQN